MSRHFDETMTILISHFLRFGTLKNLTGDYFVLRINKMIYTVKIITPYRVTRGSFCKKSKVLLEME